MAANLDASRFAVLLLSPEADESPWVGREIEHFLAGHPEDKLLFALTAGELIWDNEINDWAATSNAVPDELRGRLSAEPCWVDLRWARNVEDLSLRDTRFRAAVATLAAPVHGVSKDDLEGEDIHTYHRFVRIRRTAVTALILLLALSLVGVFGMYLFRGQTIDARGQTKVERSLKEQVQAKSEELETANGQLDQANADLGTANGKLAELEAFAATAAGEAICQGDYAERLAVASATPFDQQAAEEELKMIQIEAQAALSDPALTRDELVAVLNQIKTTPYSRGRLSTAAIAPPPVCSTEEGYPFRDRWIELFQNAETARGYWD